VRALRSANGQNREAAKAEESGNGKGKLMDTTLILIALGAFGLYLLNKSQTTNSPTSTPSVIPTIGVAPPSSCAPVNPSMAATLLQAAGGLPGATQMSGLNWDGLLVNKLFGTSISGAVPSAQLDQLMTACDYVNLRASVGAGTTPSFYQSAAGPVPNVPSTPGMMYTIQ